MQTDDGYLKFGADWLHIIFRLILFEGADADRQTDT